ncbi:MAG: GerMN domain-containing protein [Eubacteriales bacterium]|nr:GerMN domain-containing protein [Eubacteriales bacterium]
MKKRVLVTVLLILTTMMLAACVQEPSREEGGYQLYYATRAETARGGDAIGEFPIKLSDVEEGNTQDLAQRLLEALLLPPEDPQLTSPFPGGTQLQDITISGRRAYVNFNAPYARLSGVDLSLADYCVTLTLTQLEGINAVTITANGRELPYRKTQIMTAADTLIGSREDLIRPITVLLYFLDTETGELRAQQQTLALYEGQTRVNALLEAMRLGPEGDDTLKCLLPEDFLLLSSRIEDGICYLNLSSDLTLPEGEKAQQQMIDSLVLSLCSLSGVEQVQIMVDSEIVEQLGEVEIAEPLPGAES